MPVEESYEKPKEPLGSLIMRLAFIALILLIAIVFVFGIVLQKFDPIQFIVNIVGLVVLAGLLGLAAKGVLAYIKPKPFSPTEDFRSTLIRIAKKAKPFNVKNVYLRGEDMRTYAKWGKIVGLGFLPYISGIVKKGADNKPILKKNEKGEAIYKKEWSHTENDFIQVPQYEYEPITEKDGDILIITDRHNFPLNLFIRDLDIIRANPKYVSDLLGDVFVKDVNLVPYGEFLYPAKQWQADIIHIMKENEDAAIAATHRNNLDLVSNVTQMSLGADPVYQKIMGMRSEQLSSGLADQQSR